MINEQPTILGAINVKILWTAAHNGIGRIDVDKIIVVKIKQEMFAITEKNYNIKCIKHMWYFTKEIALGNYTSRKLRDNNQSNKFVCCFLVKNNVKV